MTGRGPGPWRRGRAGLLAALHRFRQVGPVGLVLVGTVALVAVVVSVLAVRTASERSDRVDELEAQLATTEGERDATATEQQRLSDELAELGQQTAVAESRWLAAVATSGEHSPTDSRLLAVEAVTREPTVAAMAALSTVLFADPRSEAPVTTLGHDGPVWITQAMSGLLVTGSGDASVGLWSDDGTPITSLDHGAAVEAAALVSTSGGPVIATGSDDGVAQVWTVGGEVLAQAEHDGEVNAVAIDAEATVLASGASDGRALVTDIASGRLEHELLHDDVVWSVALSDDGRRLATGSADGLARLWDLQTGDLIVSHDLRQPVLVVSFSPDGQWLFAGGLSTRPLLVDALTGAVGPALDATMPGGILDVAWRGDGSELTVVALGGVNRFALPGGEVIDKLQVAGGKRDAAYGPDGSWLVLAAGDFQFNFGNLTFWDTATGQQLGLLNLAGPVESVAVHPESGAVVAGYRATEDEVEVGSAWLVPGPDDWVAQACAGTDGTIGEGTWETVTGQRSPQPTACP